MRIVVVFESDNYFKNDAVRSRMCKRLRNPGINSLELVPRLRFGLRNHLMDVGSRVSTEFRRHGIPSVFFTSVYSVFRAELAKILAEFRRIPCRIIP